MATKRSENQLWETLKKKLQDQGIELEALSDIVAKCGSSGVKVICAAADDLGVSIDELAGTSRDQVVMVRVDRDTVAKLDMWVETGAVKSRSEAAALFIKEGLKVRASELDELTDVIDDVKKAKERLRSRAARVFGDGDES